MLELVLKSLYFFLPAYFANMAPVLFNWVPFAGNPVSEKWFGMHKTWRGLVVAPLVGVVVFWLQKIGHASGFQRWSLVNYTDFSLWLGGVLGLGAIIGDLVKSYYKRQAGIAPGERWFPSDQLDFVIGGLLGSFVFYVPPFEVVVVLLLASPLLHIVVNHVGFWLKVRKTKW